MDEKSPATKNITIGMIIASLGGIALGLDSVAVTEKFSSVINSQIAQAGFFFTLAAWIHSGRVKKEIKAQFEPLTAAINGVREALRQDLESQSKRISGIEIGVVNLTSRVDSLEKTRGI